MTGLGEFYDRLGRCKGVWVSVNVFGWGLVVLALCKGVREGLKASGRVLHYLCGVLEGVRWIGRM